MFRIRARFPIAASLINHRAPYQIPLELLNCRGTIADRRAAGTKVQSLAVYTTIDYEMFKESTYPYTNIKRINQEKERILLHLDAIKADCDALSADVQKTLKLKDVVEEDSFADFSATEKEDEEDE